MTIDHPRRTFFRKSASAAGALTALSMLPPAIRKALATPANTVTGTIKDVRHVVIFTQENRSFDHYFGSLAGVRGFSDRFPIPVPDTGSLTGKTVWYQRNDTAAAGTPTVLSPQHNDTAANFALMRTADTPHLYPDAQDAWDGGRMTSWPQYKRNASMVYYTERDIPFQFALANAFTICDNNHCAFTGGTNPNRCYIYTGTNHGKDVAAAPGQYVYNGPALDNSYNNIANYVSGTATQEGYTWTTYAERLQAAGVTWKVYKPAAQDYSLNSLLGFKSFRDAKAADAGSRTALQRELYARGIQTYEIADLKNDVVNGTLPQVSWICATSSGSEHPSASSPAQGAEYIAQILDALTANADVWGSTVLILNFDENDGFFDHVPPPAPPSYVAYSADASAAALAGASTVDVSDDYLGDDDGGITSTDPYKHHPYGMGPRVPMYVISPWSRGGWVNSQVFDHTSTIQFLEKCFGVQEPNISPWRRAVAGDLTSCLNFATPDNDDAIAALPDTTALDTQSRALKGTTTPAAPATPSLPAQAAGIRPSRALPYEAHTSAVAHAGAGKVTLAFSNTAAGGAPAVVFHVYDRKHLDALPRRYTVEPGKQLAGDWDVSADNGAYDLWVLGPAGFHRHFTGTVPAANAANPEVQVCYDPANGAVYLKVHNTGSQPVDVTVAANEYFDDGPWTLTAKPGAEAVRHWALADSGNWYDFTVTAAGLPDYTRRFAGRVETGKDGTSDPALGGPAVGDQVRIGKPA